MYPRTRLRRLRRTEGLRGLTAETRLHEQDLIYPLFVVPGRGREEKIGAMPGVWRYSLDLLAPGLEELKSQAVLVFGVPDEEYKGPEGASAADPEGIVPEAVRVIRETRPDLVVATDVCLCGYTTHGHCGALTGDGELANDRSLGWLARTAVSHARAGAHLVAPSAMLDGQVSALRRALDEKGMTQTGILSYAAKFSSSYYGPFREAAHSAPGEGDRRSYQLPPPNRREAVREALLDEKEGADWLMVKPALPYLDVLAELRTETRLPIAAYQVSGEYASLKLGAREGLWEEREAVMESLLSIKRAGADAIITYYAEEVQRWIRG
jgi:porphobilinogen synthase